MSQEIISLAESLYLDLVNDIGQAKTREEHIRVTARANVAKAILAQLSPLTEA
jgi:hypothetical protein